MQLNKIPWVQIAKYAEVFGLDPDHVAACVMVESSGERYSARFEPAFKYLLNPKKFADLLHQSVETEETQQKTSWGFMHVMGAVARELGFEGYLPELTDADTGIKYGCLKLQQLLRRYPDIYDAIAAYNAGSVRKDASGKFVNQIHVDRFNLWLTRIQSGH